MTKFKHAVSCALWGLRRWIARNVLTSSVVVFGSTICAFYYTAIDLWRDDYAFFTDNIPEHQLAFFMSFAFVVIIATGQWLIERRQDDRLEQTEELLMSFMKMVGSIVQAKLIRNKSKMETLTTKKFSILASPIEQIEVIFSASTEFMKSVFRLEEPDIDITIIHKAPGKEWIFLLSHQKDWKHSPAAELMKAGTCANKAVSTGEYEFYPSKKLAEANGCYEMGHRDRESGDGSIFCAPIFAVCGGKRHEFVLSIVTYGKILCNPADEDNELKVKSLLREISRRVEMELCMKVVKDL